VSFDRQNAELIYRDIEKYPNSAFSDIHQRIWKEINVHKIRRVLKRMVESQKIFSTGDKRWRRCAKERKLLNTQ